MAAFLPPDTRELIRRIIRRNARRARRLSTSLAPLAATRERREALRALTATLPALRGAIREDLFFGPEMRAWLAAAETGLALARPAAAVTDLDLFDLVARGPHLPELLPSGRLDRGFRRRAARLGDRILARVFTKLPILLAFLTPADGGFGPFTPDASADAEEARREGEIHFDFPFPATMSLRKRARLHLVPGGVHLRCRNPMPAWRPREVIGSRIVVARRAVSTRSSLRPGPHVPGIADRLGRALDLLRLAWTEAHDEVLAHTRTVVPLMEKGTVSYSLPDRPGTSYINVWGKSLVDLADDLLHEAAHHRLHGLEELEGPLDRDDGEPRYRSPWRRSIRPLHGILHATYTFTWRAELLRRLLILPDGEAVGYRLPRSKIRRELAFELGALRRALRDVRDAEGRGLLTPAGRRLGKAAAARVRRLVQNRT